LGPRIRSDRLGGSGSMCRDNLDLIGGRDLRAGER
jgi:hypothetical protein